jgi:hypothetical protein
MASLQGSKSSLIVDMKNNSAVSRVSIWAEKTAAKENGI